VEMIRGAHFDDVGVCFDCGHAHMVNSVKESFNTLRNYIQSTHIHDNGKEVDSHLWPGQGSIDWKEAIELLRTAPHTPPLMLELAEDEKVNPLEKFSETFEKLDAE
jgi:sugar phosphate isomerase/epimerase